LALLMLLFTFNQDTILQMMEVLSGME